MTLTVEDGTGLADADSYVSVQNAGLFHESYGTIDPWMEIAAANAMERMLRQATEALDAIYQWDGLALDVDQALGLPRMEFYDRTGRLWTPLKQIAKAADATALLALRLWQDQDDNIGRANVVSERIGDYSITYDGPKQARHPEIDRMVRPLYSRGGMSQGAVNVGVVRWS